MKIAQWLTPCVCTLFGIYCLILSILAFSYPTPLRGGGMLFGMLILVLAFVHVRLVLSSPAEPHIKA